MAIEPFMSFQSVFFRVTLAADKIARVPAVSEATSNLLPVVLPWRVKVPLNSCVDPATKVMPSVVTAVPVRVKSLNVLAPSITAVPEPLKVRLLEAPQVFEP